MLVKSLIGEMEDAIVCKLTHANLRWIHREQLAWAPESAHRDIAIWREATEHHLIGRVFHHYNTEDDSKGVYSGQILINGLCTSWRCWAATPRRCKALTRAFINRMTLQYNRRIKWTTPITVEEWLASVSNV